MTTELENEVREAMAMRAGALPSGVVSRVRAMDYRPRRRRTPAMAGVLAGAATAGTVVAVVVGGGAPAAYAGWSATPTSAAAPSPSAAASCQDQLSATHDGPQGAVAPLGSGTWQNVLTDVRGPFTVALFQNDGAYAACFTGTSFTEVNQISSAGNAGASAESGSVSVHSQTGSAPAGDGQSPSGGFTSVSVSGTSSGDLQNVVQTHLSTPADGPYTLVDGRTASGVTGVTLVRDDGQDVVATVADGWFVAWWPDSTDTTSAQVTTASGTTTEALVSLPKSAPGVCQPAPSSPSSGSSGPSVCHSAGSAPSNPGNTARSTGNSGDSGSGNSGSGNSGNCGNSRQLRQSRARLSSCLRERRDVHAIARGEASRHSRRAPRARRLRAPAHRRRAARSTGRRRPRRTRGGPARARRRARGARSRWPPLRRSRARASRRSPRVRQPLRRVRGPPRRRHRARSTTPRRRASACACRRRSPRRSEPGSARSVSTMAANECVM